MSMNSIPYSFNEKESEAFFTWPLWTYPAGPDSIRSLSLLAELYRQVLDIEDRAALRARGVEAVFRSRRIKVGMGANFKINFSPAKDKRDLSNRKLTHP